MAAFRTLVDDKLGALQHLCAFSKVDDEAALGICANQKKHSMPKSSSDVNIGWGCEIAGVLLEPAVEGGLTNA